jgi:hypothetical protein
MKNETVNHRNYFLISISTTIQLCQRKLKSLSLRHLLSSSLEPSFYSALEAAVAHVLRGTLSFRVAFQELVSNKRHVVGFSLIVVGCASGMLYHFFNPLAINKEWYFLNWYYFLYTIREELAVGLWAVGTFLLLPSKYKLSFIPCGVLLTYSIAYIIHYSFFVDSLESFHSDVLFSMWVAAGALAIGFIVSVDYLAYRKYHLKDGTAARIIGMVGLPNMSADDKMNIMEGLVKESENFNARI